MVTKEMRLAACEINQILRYVEERNVNKIPLGLRLFLKDIADDYYIPEINPDISLFEHKLLPETEEILAMIYYFYWTDEVELNQLSEDRKRRLTDVSNDILNGYPKEELFEKEKEQIKTNMEVAGLSTISKEPWYKRFFGWFKKK